MSKRIWIPVFLVAGLLAGGLFYSLMDDEDDEELDEEYYVRVLRFFRELTGTEVRHYAESKLPVLFIHKGQEFSQFSKKLLSAVNSCHLRYDHVL